MRTTIDLPDELLRRVKVRAALAGLTLKDLITAYVEAGLRQGVRPAVSDESRPPRSPLPVIEKAATGTPIPALSRTELTRIDFEEDLAHHDRSAGR